MHDQHLHFFQRPFPSANMILLKGDRPILVDTGFGTDYAETVRLLTEQGTPPENLHLVVNTHYHCDHVGGNHGLQRDYRLPVAAHAWDAAMVNRRDPMTGSAVWLDQAIEPYRVERALQDGDVLATGTAEWQVIHAMGHTLGHIVLYADGFLIAGDTIHADDIAWMNPFREGAAPIDRMLHTLDRLARLPLKRSFSGHGPVAENPLQRIDEARHRYERWLAQPEKVAWHAAKRIFTYALMLFDGMDRGTVPFYLQTCGWYLDYCRYVWGANPHDFVDDLLAELMRAQAAEWRGDRLYPTAPYRPVPPQWNAAIPRPAQWPKA